MPDPLHLTLNPLEVSREVILRVMAEAEEGGQHTPGSWTKEGALHHIIRSMDHLFNAVVYLRHNDPRWLEELEHGHTRSGLGLHCHYVLGDDLDHGPEGQG